MVKHKFKPLTRDEETRCLLKIKEIINGVVEPYWPRTQSLHDNAYEIVQRMIAKNMKEAFPNKEIEIIDYDFETQQPADVNPYHVNYIMGYLEMIRGVFTWEPRPGTENVPLNLEMSYILSKKKAVVMKALEKSVFADGIDFEKLLF